MRNAQIKWPTLLTRIPRRGLISNVYDTLSESFFFVCWTKVQSKAVTASLTQ